MALEQAVGASTYLGQRMMMGKRQASLGLQGGSQWLSTPVLVLVFATPDSSSSSITLCALAGILLTPSNVTWKAGTTEMLPPKGCPWVGGGVGWGRGGLAP